MVLPRASRPAQSAIGNSILPLFARRALAVVCSTFGAAGDLAHGISSLPPIAGNACQVERRQFRAAWGDTPGAKPSRGPPAAGSVKDWMPASPCCRELRPPASPGRRLSSATDQAWPYRFRRDQRCLHRPGVPRVPAQAAAARAAAGWPADPEALGSAAVASRRIGLVRGRGRVHGRPEAVPGAPLPRVRDLPAGGAALPLGRRAAQGPSRLFFGKTVLLHGLLSVKQEPFSQVMIGLKNPGRPNARPMAAKHACWSIVWAVAAFRVR